MKTVFVRFQGDNGIWSAPAGASIGLNTFLLQYASSVLGYSSQYSASTWSASQATGAPNVSVYGDNSKAWTSSSKNGTTPDSREYITLGFETPVYAEGAVIRETWGNGFVTKVEVVDTEDQLHTVWEGTDPSQPGTVAEFDVSWPRTSFLVKGVRITVNPSHDMTRWEEIDAVQLRGSTEPSKKLLLVSLTGSGTGSITGTTGGIPCSESCFALVERGTEVVLNAAPGSGSYLRTWAGACTGTGECRFTLTDDATVTALFTPNGEWRFSLSPGWNFMSLPLQPGDTSIGSVLGAVLPGLRVAWGFDNETNRWRRYRPSSTSCPIPPASPSPGDLCAVEAGKGYWLYLDAAAELILTGSAFASPVPLFAGWNLVGYHGEEGKTATKALESISGLWSSLWGWEAGTWYLTHDAGMPVIPIEPLTTLNRGKAYWIKMKEAAEWEQ